ncbi:hypothetical protein Pla22_40610 [Rubripirellula amarantea]|uniref:Uncharacterized protein n=1 Tax=Rubripirellula amarantea TaxID=2527999 RepID=A0A5C5WKI6_9BACT|nr:hypothetical protein Pla22_40610 [Rubripirellula amarantea]
MKFIQRLTIAGLVFGVFSGATIESADAGGFLKKLFCCKKACCEPEPECCEPEPEPICCEPEPVCCEPEPVCCEPEPVCCEPAPEPEPVCCEPEPICEPEPVCCEPEPEPVCEPEPAPCCASLISPPALAEGEVLVWVQPVFIHAETTTAVATSVSSSKTVLLTSAHPQKEISAASIY